MTPDSLADLAFAPVLAALAAARIPGASLGLVRADGARATRHGGVTSLDAPSPVRPDTLFDLASLTKVLHTTPAILRLVERGLADLDDPLSAHLPDLRQYQPDHFVRRTTLRDCLAHRTALPAVEPIYTWGTDPAALRALVLQRDWPAAPPAYSDINFILLGLLAERLAPDAPLPPGLVASPGPDHAAATEHCHWRNRTLRGEVHDENAFALGGLAGHAGLFGTADAVLDEALKILQGTWLSPACLDLMARPQRTLPTPRGLGWELPHDGWSGGSLCSPGTIGHLGFTGTGLWIDRPRGLAWTLLTNRVHPSRHRDTGIAALRRTVSNIVSAGA